MSAFSNVDSGGDYSDRKSQSGFLIYSGDTLLAWDSNKQPILARSSTKGEYRALVAAVEQMEAIRMLLDELGVYVPKSQRIKYDNLGATFVAQNPILSHKLKHVAMDFHFISERH